MIILAFVVIALVAGYIANYLVGKGRGFEQWEMFVAGLVGSFVGGLDLQPPRGQRARFHITGLIGSTIGAIVVLAIYGPLRSRLRPSTVKQPSTAPSGRTRSDRSARSYRSPRTGSRTTTSGCCSRRSAIGIRRRSRQRRRLRSARSSPRRASDLRTRPEASESGRSISASRTSVDAELVIAGRYRWILAHDEPDILPYDQDLWVDRFHVDPGRADRRDARLCSTRCGAADIELWRRTPARRSRALRPAPRAWAGELRADVQAHCRTRPGAHGAGPRDARAGPLGG